MQAPERINAHGIKIFDPFQDREREIRLKKRVRYVKHLHEDAKTHEAHPELSLRFHSIHSPSATLQAWYKIVVSKKKTGSTALPVLKGENNLDIKQQLEQDAQGQQTGTEPAES